LTEQGKLVKQDGKYFVDTSDTLTLPMFDLPKPELHTNGFNHTEG